MAIKTDYQDFVLKEGRNREFDIVQNPNLSTSLIERDDAYETIGDYTGAGVLNELGTRAMYLFTQTVSGSVVSFDTEDMVKTGTTINGAVLISEAIPSGATFKVNGVTVPAYMGDDLVTDLPVGKWASFVYDGTQLNFKGGSGGGLNFAVIAVASEEELPATAKENTIAVITETAFENYTFAPTEPTTPTAGDLCIITNERITAFVFNALTKNVLLTYPTGVTQWVGSTWETKESKIYQGGTWKDFRIYYFNNAELSGMTWTEGGDYGTTMTKTTELFISGAATSFAMWWLDVDFTNISTIHFSVSSQVVAGNNAEFSGVGVIGGTDYNPLTTQWLAKTLASSIGSYSLDVSAVTGIHRLVVSYAITTSGSGNIGVNQIWGE